MQFQNETALLVSCPDVVWPAPRPISVFGLQRQESWYGCGLKAPRHKHCHWQVRSLAYVCGRTYLVYTYSVLQIPWMRSCLEEKGRGGGEIPDTTGMRLWRMRPKPLPASYDGFVRKLYLQALRGCNIVWESAEIGRYERKIRDIRPKTLLIANVGHEVCL